MPGGMLQRIVSCRGASAYGTLRILDPRSRGTRTVHSSFFPRPPRFDWLWAVEKFVAGPRGFEPRTSTPITLRLYLEVFELHHRTSRCRV